MLADRTVLLVEEEFLIALDVQRVLEMLGVRQTILARTADQAMLTRPTWSDCTLAIVEIRQRAACQDLLDHLAHAQVRVVVITSSWDIVREFASGTPVLLKPVPEADLIEAITAALTP